MHAPRHLVAIAGAINRDAVEPAQFCACLIRRAAYRAVAGPRRLSCLLLEISRSGSASE
jgi:hypothetical protein